MAPDPHRVDWGSAGELGLGAELSTFVKVPLPTHGWGLVPHLELSGSLDLDHPGLGDHNG